jgi:TetR/AcrR family transcriptional regulator, cholesterol catabolism regulator
MTEVELSRRERKKEETRERIFQAAMRLFKQKGFEATTVDEIAEKADVAKGTFFNYFPHKEAIFAYLGESWFAQAEEESAAILAKPGRLAPRLIAMFAELAAFYEEQPALARYVLQEWMRNQHTGEDEMCLRWDSLAMRLIEKLRANGEMRSDETAERLAGVIHCVHQGTILEYVASPTPPFPLRTELRRRLMLAIEGLAPRGGK